MNTDEFILHNLASHRGTGVAQRYAQQTLRVYRRAVLNPAHFASTSHYRRAFIMSYLFYKHYLLASRITPPDMPTASTLAPSRPDNPQGSAREAEDCEYRIDNELAASMPASDAPSWTLGGSCVSKHQLH